MTLKAVRTVKRKHNLFRRYRDINYPKYIEAVQMTRTETRRANINFEKKFAQNIKMSNKSFYAYARSRSNIRTSTEPILSASGELKTEAGDMAEELNNYVHSVFTKEDINNLPRACCPPTAILHDIVISAEMAMTKFNKLRAVKATGVDNISPRLLVEIKDVICLPLTIIFQNLLKSG